MARKDKTDPMAPHPSQPKPARKITQIATATAGDGSEQWPVLYALADDGTVWQKHDLEMPWKRVKDLPEKDAPPSP